MRRAPGCWRSNKAAWRVAGAGRTDSGTWPPPDTWCWPPVTGRGAGNWSTASPPSPSPASRGPRAVSRNPSEICHRCPDWSPPCLTAHATPPPQNTSTGHLHLLLHSTFNIHIKYVLNTRAHIADNINTPSRLLRKSRLRRSPVGRPRPRPARPRPR